MRDNTEGKTIERSYKKIVLPVKAYPQENKDDNPETKRFLQKILTEAEMTKGERGLVSKLFIWIFLC